MSQHLKPFLRHLLAGSLLATVLISAWGANDSAIQFEISRFEVKGNTLLPQTKIDALLSRYVGKNRDFGDVQAALEALEKIYQDNGYSMVTVQLPEQEMDHGTVVFHVLQTKIAKILIEGNRHFDAENIRRSLPTLLEGQSPNLKAISQSLKLANENPAKKVVMSMKSRTQDDQVDATLTIVDESIWRTTVNLDNTGVASTGRTRAGVVIQNANMFDLDHVMSLQYTTTLEEPSHVGVYGIGYHIPLYIQGDSMDFYASYSDVNAGTVSAGIFDIAVSGKGYMYGARYNQNLTGVGNYESKMLYGIDLKQYKNSMQLLGIELGSDITVRPISVAYQGDWSWANGSASFMTTLLHNISGGTNGQQSDFDKLRFDAKASYTAARVGTNLTQALPAQWLARAIINGQYTKDALILGEQFGAGGASSVRGFLEREVSNDSGITGNFEVYTAPLCGISKWQCRALAFYDHAYLTRNHALAGEFTTLSISSIGLGLRLQLANDVNFQVDVGHVLQAEATATRSGDNRVHARLSLSF